MEGLFFVCADDENHLLNSYILLPSLADSYTLLFSFYDPTHKKKMTTVWGKMQNSLKIIVNSHAVKKI